MDDIVKEIFGSVMDDGPTKVEASATPSSPPMSDPTAEPVGDRQPEPMSRLAQFVMANFRENASARRMSGIDERLAYALRSSRLSYTSEQRDKLRQSGIDPRLYSPVTFTKSRAARSLLVDLINSCGEPLFKIEPSPEPDMGKAVEESVSESMGSEIDDLFAQIASSGVDRLPPDMMALLQKLIFQVTTGRYDTISNMMDAEARARANRMQRKVWDMMYEGHFMEEFFKFVGYLCTYGTAVMLGPVSRAELVNRCSSDKDSKVVKYRSEMKVRQVFEAVNPYDCYPPPDARDAHDGPLCIRVKFSGSELGGFLVSCRKGGSKTASEGWNIPALSKVLAAHPTGGVHITEEPYGVERRRDENSGPENVFDSMFEGVRCFASVRGSILAEMGIVRDRSGRRIEYDTYYSTETIVIDGVVVKCRLFDERVGIPVSKSVFYELPGSWWGESIADKLYMCQYIQNNCIKALVTNMAAASGPQVWINDAQRLVAKGPDAYKFRPWKVWAFGQSMMGGGGAPMGVVEVPSNADELLKVFEKFRIQADLDSGVPAYSEGQSAGQSGALRTASGLAMYTEATTRGMKMIMTGIDNTCIRDCARRTADWILVNDSDMDAKGDVEVRAVGLIGRVLKAQRDQQRMQLFNMVLNSQVLQQIVGIKGVIAMFRPSVQDVDINPDDVVPNEERMKELELLEKIKQVFQATANANGVQESAGEQSGGGAPPGVQQPPAPGTVAERRGVA